MKDLKFLLGFLLLNVYLRVVPSLWNGSEVLWLATFIGFFPLVHVVGKWSSGAGLNDQGLARGVRWKKWLGTGVLIGSLVWILLTLAELVLGSLHFTGWQPLGAASWIAVQALVVALLGSATNDVMTRGYVFAHWKNRLPAVFVVLLSTILYVADDIWLEGWSLRNNIFSFILGLAFALSLLRTGSLWMNIGMHAGLNVIYYLVHGFGGGAVHYGIFTSASQPTAFSPYLGIFGASAMLALSLRFTRKGRIEAGKESNTPSTTTLVVTSREPIK